MGTTRRGWLAGAAAAASTPRAAAAQAPAGERLLVIEKADHTLGLLDLSTGRRLAGLTLPGAFPHEFAVDPVRGLAYVAHYGVETSTSPGEGGSAVFVVDLRTLTLARTLDAWPFGRLHGVRLDARGRLFVLAETQDVLLGFENPAPEGPPDRAVRTGAIRSHLFALTRDGSRAYVSGLLSNTVALVRPDDPAAAPVVLAAGRGPEGSALSPDERTLVVASRRSRTLLAADAKLKLLHQAPSRGDVVRLTGLPDGRWVAACLSERCLAVLRPDLTEIGVVALDGAPQSVSLHPTRPLAYAALDSPRVAVVDLERMRVEGHLETGRGPDVTSVLPG